MEPAELEAWAKLYAWMEQYGAWARKVKRLAPVVEILEQLGIGRAYLAPGWYLVYGLKDPIDHKIKYVGITNRPEERWQEHQRDVRNPGKDAWVQRLKLYDERPILVELERVAGLEEARRHEQAWIAFYQSLGYPLYNAESRWQEEQSG